MNLEEKIRLEKHYALLSDAQIMQMVSDGPRAYVDGAYALVLEEARRRGLESSDQTRDQPAVSDEPPSPASETEEVTFVELAVLNSARDRECVQAALDGVGMAYNFLHLHIRQERELPVALLVDQSRLDDAVRALAGCTFQASIPLW